MFDQTNPLRRLIVIVSCFALFVFTGLVSMQYTSDTSGSISFDAYKILKLFVLSGDWVFEENANSYLVAQAYLAPVFTVISIIEIFTSQLASHIHQTVRLFFVRDHVILAGLSQETVYLLKSMNNADRTTTAAIIDPTPDEALSRQARKLGAILIKADPADPRALARARIERASLAVSFLVDAADSLQFVLSTNETISAGASASHNKGGVDLWLRLGEAGLGLRLTEYFKFAGLAGSAHPRFFSIEEIAARRLFRAHPPDIYADAQGHSEIHLALYGFTHMTIQLLTESLRQCVWPGAGNLNISIYTDDTDECRAQVRSLFPALDQMASLRIVHLQTYPNGLAEDDYAVLPDDAAMHIVCYDRPEVAVSVALSLRRLLLAPPPARGGTKARLMNAPILVRLSNTRGIGELLSSNIDRRERVAQLGDSLVEKREIPDGIFAFGAVEDLLTGPQDDVFIPTLIDPVRERIAKFLHLSYVFDRTALRKVTDPGAPEFFRAEKEWERLAPEFRESSRQSADHIWSKARIVGLRVEARKGASKPVQLEPAEKRQLAEVEHKRWVNERLLSGWSYGEKRVDAARRHHNMVPWEQLSENETKIDLGIASRIGEAVESVGLSLSRELVIGIVGHRPHGRAFDAKHVRARMTEEVKKLIDDNPDRCPVILTSLAEGADTIAAEIALDLNVPYRVPLPMPYEAYSQDFPDETNNAKTRSAGDPEPCPNDLLRKLVALSERYIELPLKFGDLTDVSLEYGSGNDNEARNRQYALAGAYIAERADAVIAVWDGEPASGIGGTGEVVAWRAEGRVPEEFHTDPTFRRQPALTPAIIIHPVTDEK